MKCLWEPGPRNGHWGSGWLITWTTGWWQLKVTPTTRKQVPDLNHCELAPIPKHTHTQSWVPFWPGSQHQLSVCLAQPCATSSPTHLSRGHQMFSLDASPKHPQGPSLGSEDPHVIYLPVFPGGLSHQTPLLTHGTRVCCRSVKRPSHTDLPQVTPDSVSLFLSPVPTL